MGTGFHVGLDLVDGDELVQCLGEEGVLDSRFARAYRIQATL